MKNKRILLVEDKYDDIISIQNSLKGLNGQHTLHVVHNIRDALQVLMGGSSHYGMENYSQTGKVRPDIVLLNIAFLQESAREFLEVMQKYYSLKSIKVYITGDSHQTLDPQLAIKYGIAGYLVKPIDLQDTLNESVINFRQELLKPGKALFSLAPLVFLQKQFVTAFNYLKAKSVFYYFGSTAAAKVTGSVAATVLAVGMLSSSAMEESVQRTEQSVLPARFAPAPAAVAPALVVEEESRSTSEPIVTEKKPAVPKAAAKRVELIPEPVAPPDQKAEDRLKKNYRIVAIEEAE